MTNNKIKTGILSFGMSGKVFHAPFIAENEGFELVAVVERTNKNAHNIYPTIKSYDSVDALLADTQIELVVVNTPNATHFEFAQKALQAKKHVLVEKAFTVTSAEAKQLFKLAKENNCHILPYQNRRYDSDFQSVKDVVESGKLGKLVEFHIRFDRYRYAIGPKAAKETNVPGSGITYDLGPHLLDQIISLFGNPKEWHKSNGQFRPKTQVDDYSHIHLVYENGLQVFVTLSMLVADAQPAFVINGTKGSYIKPRADVQEKQLLDGISLNNPTFGVEEDGNYGLLTIISDNGDKIQEEIASKKSTYMHVYDDVYATIRENKQYPVTQNQIVKQLEILEA